MPPAWNESVAATVIWIVFHVANAALLWWLLTDKEINTFEEEEDDDVLPPPTASDSLVDGHFVDYCTGSEK